MVSTPSPTTVAELEQRAPSSTWTRQALAGLDAELVVLRTKEPSRFVVRGERVAVATLEAAAPLFAPLDRTRAQRLVDALRSGEVVDGEAPARLEHARFPVRPPAPATTSTASTTAAFSFTSFELRAAQSAPALVFVTLTVTPAGVVTRAEHVVAAIVVEEVAAGGLPGRARAPDRSADIARFVAACRG